MMLRVVVFEAQQELAARVAVGDAAVDLEPQVGEGLGR
jgi:hypothetical protein